MNLAYAYLELTGGTIPQSLVRLAVIYNDTQMDMAILIKQFTVQYGPNSQTG